MAEKDNTVLMEGVRIIFRNFRGEPGRYNAAGDRNFAVLLPDDVAEAMSRDGWNVKTLKPREEGDPEQPYLTVKVNYGGRPPRVVMITSGNRTELSESEVDLLDFADIINVDLIVNPYQWEVGGKTGITAYLKTMFVTIQEDELERKYAQSPSDGLNE